MQHRVDIQGLRGVAVLLVVLDHCGIRWLQGGYVGVDVFFVLSGFLITGLLLSEANRSGSVSLIGFYVRRARRILPAATLTLVATDLAAYLLLNFVRARTVMVDSIWSALFAANVRFARVGTDYFAQWQPQSPLQHFWTLAVEEQFYLVWPAVLSAVLLGRITFVRARRPASEGAAPGSRALNRLLLVGAAATSASLAWSIHATRVAGTDAYFSSVTRAWELGVGALLAIAATSRPALLARARKLGPCLGWAGLAAVAVAATTYSDTTLFPGYAALLPVAGAAALIATGGADTSRRPRAETLLASRPLTYVGDRSYALYLWHWPFLIIATERAGHDLSTARKLLLEGLAMLASIVSYRGFENPLRRLRWPVPGGILMWPASVTAVVGVAVLALASLNGKAASAVTGPKPAPLADRPAVTSAAGAAPLPAVVAAVKAAVRGAPLPKPLTPAVSDLLKDAYSFPRGCAPNEKETKSKVCKLGSASGAKTLVVMGDSFAQQWMPAILAMARRDGWVVVPLVNGSGCSASTWRGYAPRPWCAVWYQWAVAQAKALHPEATLVSGEWASDSPPAAATGAESLIASAKKFSRSLVVLGVPPLQSRQPVDCLLRHGATMKSCTTIIPGSRSSANDTAIAAYAKRNHVPFISPLGWFCARATTSRAYWCPLVINRTITRLDLGHVTAPYATELAAPFRGAFRRALFS